MESLYLKCNFWTQLQSSKLFTCTINFLGPSSQEHVSGITGHQRLENSLDIFQSPEPVLFRCWEYDSARPLHFLILNFMPQKHIVLPDNWNKVQDMKRATKTKFLPNYTKVTWAASWCGGKSKQENCHDCICSL